MDVLSSFNTNSYDLTEQWAVKSKRRSEGIQKYAVSYCKKKQKNQNQKKQKEKNTMADVTICFGLFHFFEVALITWQWGILQSFSHAVRRVGRQRNREASCGSAALLVSTWRSSISEYQHLHIRIPVPQCINEEILDNSLHIVMCSPQGKNVFTVIFWQPKQIFCKRTVCRLSHFNWDRAKTKTYVMSLCLQKYNFGDWCEVQFWGTGVILDSHINSNISIRVRDFISSISTDWWSDACKRTRNKKKMRNKDKYTKNCWHCTEMLPYFKCVFDLWRAWSSTLMSGPDILFI